MDWSDSSGISAAAAEGIHAIARAVNAVPWRLQLKLNDNCLCGLASFYLDCEWTTLGAYTSLAFDSLVQWLAPAAVHTSHDATLGSSFASHARHAMAPPWYDAVVAKSSALHVSGVGGELLPFFGRLGALLYLDLGYNRALRGDVADLAGATELRYLDLRWCPCRGRGPCCLLYTSDAADE